MARIRFAHNSFSTGLVSKKVQGNTEFEGYNNALDECTNFQVMHTGGVIKRGGTVFVANTKYNKPVKLFPFVYSSLESYMCEFGDLDPKDMHKGPAGTTLPDNVCDALGYPNGLRYNSDGYIVDSSGRLMERGYIRFYTASGVTRIPELFVPFTLEDLKTGNILQEGNLLDVVTSIGLYRIIRENNFKFRITDKDDYVNSPKTFSVNAPVYLKPTLANDPNGNYQIIVQNAKSGENPIEEKYWGAIKISDKGSYLYLKYMLDNGLAFYCLKITDIEFHGGRPNKIFATIYPRLCINCLKEKEGSDQPGNFKFPENDLATLNWSVSAFTEERGHPEAVALYERRLFLASNKENPTGIWGSSMQFDNTMDFTPDNTSLGALQIKMGSQYTDKILWMIGQSKLFIGTNGGIFMAGAPDEKVQISATNISVRLFDAVSAFPLPPVVGGESVFFVDSSEKNVHEIILSSETGMYKANDVSLLANELTSSGIVSHCWTQHPIKTYWCVTKAGHLCALTYLKNNGILAWSKHELAGGRSAKAECVAAMKHEGEDHLWLCVNRNKVSGEDNRQIEYMSHSYNSRDVEDCQHYLDSGKSKTDDTEIIKIETSVHTKIIGDFHLATNIITRRRNCSVIFEHIPKVSNILNKNLSFFIQTPSETEACILRDFTYEHEHTDGKRNQLSPRDRGMIDPSRFGETTDADKSREYYYEVASIEDFEVAGIWNHRLKLDTVEFLTADDRVVIFAWENEGLESISTKRDPANSTQYNKFVVTSIDKDRLIVTLNVSSVPLTGKMEHGMLYKLQSYRMNGYRLGSETAVTCIGRGGTGPVPLGLPKNIEWTPPTDYDWNSICFGTPISSSSGIFIAVRIRSDYSMYSYDGINWSQAKLPHEGDWASVCWGGGKFVAVANGSTEGAYSYDGIEWTKMDMKWAENNSVCYGNGKFVSVGWSTHDSRIQYSIDGIKDWKDCVDYDYQNANRHSHVCYGGGVFVVVPYGNCTHAYANNAYFSRDGYVWRRAGILSNKNEHWHSVCFGNGMFVAVGDYINAERQTSNKVDEEWSGVPLPFNVNWGAVCYGNGKFVALGYGNDKAAYSYDGINWKGTNMPSSSSWKSVCYGQGKFIAVKDSTGEPYAVAYSYDGVNWKALTGPNRYENWKSVCYAPDFLGKGGMFVAIDSIEKDTAETSYEYIIACSTDGIFWNESTVSNFNESVGFICYANGKFFVFSDEANKAIYSVDLVTWHDLKMPNGIQWKSACYGGGKFVAIPKSGHIGAYSDDGITWHEMIMQINGLWKSVCYGNGKFIAVMHHAVIVSCSEDGITWVLTDIPYGGWLSVCYGNGKFVAVADVSVAGDPSIVSCSKDGITWYEIQLPVTTALPSICYSDDGFFIVSNNSYAMCSIDGITWSVIDIPKGNWNSVCYGKDKFVFVGGDRGYYTYLNAIKKIEENERIQLNSVPNMEDICNKDIFVKSCTVAETSGQWIFKFHDYWSVDGVPQPFDTCDKTDYEVSGGNDARMLHYFTSVDGLDHLEGEEVTVISNGTTFKSIVENGTVQVGELPQLKEPVKTLFCSVGLQFTASLKTVPLSGGNVTGSSVGCVGSQRSMVLHLFESWGGTYGTSEGEKRPIPYPKTADAIFNESEGLFTGTVKCPVINGDPTNRCVYIHHSEPTAFSLISMVQDVQVSDA